MPEIMRMAAQKFSAMALHFAKKIAWCKSSDKRQGEKQAPFLPL